MIVNTRLLQKLSASTKTKKSCEEEGASDIVAHKLKAKHGTSLDATETTFDPIDTWSDDDLLDDGCNAVGDEAEATIEVLGHKLSAEFRAWRSHPANVNWSKVDPNGSIRNPSAPGMLEVMGMSISALYKRLEEEGGSEFGHLPTITSCAKGQLGALNPKSVCERCMSCANLAVTDGNSILLYEEVTMLVVMRMNVDFMEFTKEQCGNRILKKHRR